MGIQNAFISDMFKSDDFKNSISLALEQAKKDNEAAAASTAASTAASKARESELKEISSPIGSKNTAYTKPGSLTSYKPASDIETEIKSNMSYKKGGMVSKSSSVARGQGAVLRKKKSARIC